MAVYVDSAVWPFRGALWAHLISDTSYEELHVFAAKLAIPRQAFQHDHYDVPAGLRHEAIRLGAVAVSRHELILTLRASGLRHRSRVAQLPQEVATANARGSKYFAGQGRV